MSNSKKGDSYVNAYIVRSKKNNCKATGLWEVQQTVEPLQTFLAPLATKYAKMLVDSIHRKIIHPSHSPCTCVYREHGISGPIQNSVLSKRFPVPFGNKFLQLSYTTLLSWLKN